MTVHVEFLNLLIPISIIQEKYRGGWKQCLRDFKHSLGGRVWFDDHLFRYGAMDYSDIETQLRRLEGMGFTLVEKRGGDGKKYWCDVCVYACLQKSEIICDWLEITASRVYLKSKTPGPHVGPYSKDMVTVRSKVIGEDLAHGDVILRVLINIGFSHESRCHSARK